MTQALTHTIGTGLGCLERAIGLTSDSLTGACRVTAAGQAVATDDNPDLLWALRGGSGNFGVITERRFALRPLGPVVLGGKLVYPAERGAGAVALPGAVAVGPRGERRGAEKDWTRAAAATMSRHSVMVSHPNFLSADEPGEDGGSGATPTLRPDARIGHAVSRDLRTWERTELSLEADPERHEHRAWRDPRVLWDDAAQLWRMYATTRLQDPEADGRGVVATRGGPRVRHARAQRRLPRGAVRARAGRVPLW